MKFTNKQMVEEAMGRITAAQEHTKAVHAAAQFLSRPNRRQNIDYSALITALYERELEDWRGLLLWGITLSDEERERVKAAAFERFLSDGRYVADWMNDGLAGGGWLTADEDQFRAMAKEVFAPKDR